MAWWKESVPEESEAARELRIQTVSIPGQAQRAAKEHQQNLPVAQKESAGDTQPQRASHQWVAQHNGSSS